MVCPREAVNNAGEEAITMDWAFPGSWNTEPKMIASKQRQDRDRRVQLRNQRGGESRVDQINMDLYFNYIIDPVQIKLGLFD